MAAPLDKTVRVLPTPSGGLWKSPKVLEGTGWGIQLLPWEQPTPSSCRPSPHFLAILGKCTAPCVQFPGEYPFLRILARKKGWGAAPRSPNRRVLPAHSGLPSRSCIFLAVAHPYTWGLHYLCSEFPSCSKTFLGWELQPHPQTLTRAPRAPFYSMTRFLEFAWSSASCPELVYCGLQPLPWELWPFLSAEEPVSTYFLAAPVCIPSPLGRANISFLRCGGSGRRCSPAPRSKISCCEPRPFIRAPPPSSSLEWHHFLVSYLHTHFPA